MYKKIKLACTALIILLLLFLFTVPAAYLDRLADALISDARMADAAVRTGVDASPALLRMRARIDESQPTLALFLDHAAVDALCSAVHALVPMPQDESLRAALAAVVADVESLRRVERFEWAELL